MKKKKKIESPTSSKRWECLAFSLAIFYDIVRFYVQCALPEVSQIAYDHASARKSVHILHHLIL
jgi:hypothetical protein